MPRHPPDLELPRTPFELAELCVGHGLGKPCAWLHVSASGSPNGGGGASIRAVDAFYHLGLCALGNDDPQPARPSPADHDALIPRASDRHVMPQHADELHEVVLRGGAAARIERARAADEQQIARPGERYVEHAFPTFLLGGLVGLVEVRERLRVDRVRRVVVELACLERNSELVWCPFRSAQCGSSPGSLSRYRPLPQPGTRGPLTREYS